ncbi:MAG: hypothetical protein PHY15_02450 [Eubacteriales bacterium]|nr:hypothetical protein [Eubacteriales bacterium]MDD4474313.1 hypothetical protein [Eubacteriales bacterium]
MIMYKKAFMLLFSLFFLMFMASCGNADSVTSKSVDTNAPVIESITQKSGTGGDIIDIYVNYDASKYGRDDFSVLIDGVKVELTTKYLSGKQFEFALPLNLEAGKKSIAVELGGKKSNEVEYEILKPEITSIDLSEISFMYYNEVSVIIGGNNLGFSKDKVKVTLNERELEIETVYKTGIKVILEKGISSGDLVVYVNGKEMKTFPITISES